MAIQSARALADRLLPRQTLFGPRRLRNVDREQRPLQVAPRITRRDEQRRSGQLDPAVDGQFARRLPTLDPIAFEQERSVLQDRLALPEPMQVFELHQICRQGRNREAKELDR